MKTATRTLCMVSVLAFGAWAQAAEEPAAQDLATSLAVESLLHSAQNLYHTPPAPARAGRLVAIANKVAAIAPDDPRALRLLSDVWQSQDKLDQAAQAARKQLQADLQNHAAGVRWIRLELARRNRAIERSEFLKGVVDTPRLPAPLRAVAAAELATLLIGQGAQADARAVLEEALELDPMNYAALVNRLDLIDEPTPADHARTLVELLRGNPRAWWLAEELAGLLGDVGLHREAIGYLMHAWRLRHGTKALAEHAPPSFAATYASALLDAAMPGEVIRMFEPQLKRLTVGDTGEFLSLMIEAYRAAGQTDNAQQLAAQTEELYRKQLKRNELAAEMQGQSAAGEMNASLATSLAWYYLLTGNQADQALFFARKAGELGAAGEGQSLLLAAAQLAGGNAAATETLQTLAGDYPLAAAILAEHYLQAGQEAAARQTLLKGFQQPRRHLGYRRLMRLAKANGYDIPPTEHAQAVRDALAGLDHNVLQMGVDPGKFIEVSLRVVEPTVELAAPIEVKTILTNTSRTPIPLGQWGLLDNMMALKVRINEVDRLTFTSLPVAVWPAPRMLAPGQTVTTTTRLDVGPLAGYLANNPLPQLKLEVIGTLSPRETREGIVSGLPQLNVPSVALKRKGLLGGWAGGGRANPDAYNRAIADVEQFLTRGTPDQRMRAARVVAGLLGWIRETEAGDTRVPEELRRVVSKPQLLGLMAQAQQNSMPVVRAELATALNYANLGPNILNQLGTMIDDPSPLVRFRVAELIGASGTKGNTQMVKMYSQDPDPMVRLMAQAFLLDPDSLDPQAPAAPRPAPSDSPEDRVPMSPAEPSPAPAEPVDSAEDDIVAPTPAPMP